MIPNEAVEAGARALCSLAGYEWEGAGAPKDVTADFHAQLLEQARTILEAAAPHMLNLAKREAWDANLEIQRLRAELADAWEAGWKACSDWDIYLDMGGAEPNTDNPYRSQE